ncbi:MAG: hypothetical protein ACRDS9_05740 [Pseudonocardiaceae bacterium]
MRLARDHTGGLCNTCEKQLAALHIGPPDVPPEFWETERFDDAFAAQHMGLVSKAYRKNPRHIALYGKDGIPQEIVGSWLGLTQAQISRIENGSPIRHLDNLAHWAKTLRIPSHLLWFTLPGEQPPRGRGRGTGPLPTPAVALHAPSSVGPFGRLPMSNGALPNGNADASAMQAFRAVDRQVGGGHLYATVVNYLHSKVAPRLFGSDHSSDGKLLFNGAAALTEMAGWMAHDAGRDGDAKQHFGRALDLAQVGGDRQLSAHILASMSHLAHHLGQPEEAIQLAQHGRKALKGGSPQPELESRLLSMQARGFAAIREPGECTQLLVQAETALAISHAEEPSQWISGFDEGSLAIEAARCMHQLGDLSEAQRQAERIIALRPDDRTRSRAFGQLILVTVLISQGKPDEACAMAAQVLNATQSLGSYLVIQQLFDLKQLLEAHRANKIVADFLVCLGQALEERLWLCQ